jgi:large subunit ribosomal protein L31
MLFLPLLLRPHPATVLARRTGWFSSSACVIGPQFSPHGEIDEAMECLTPSCAPADRGPVMKSGLHPNYHMIKVVMTDGTEFMTRSTLGKDGDTLNLDIDPKTHPAWTGGTQQLMDRGGRLSRFNSRFSGITFKK